MYHIAFSTINNTSFLVLRRHSFPSWLNFLCGWFRMLEQAWLDSGTSHSIWTFCIRYRMLWWKAKFKNNYSFNAFSSSWTCLDKEDSSYFSQQIWSLLYFNFSLALEVSLSANKKQNNLFVRVLSELLYPASKLLKGLVAIDRVKQKDSRDSFIEWTNHRPKEFLPCLNPPLSTVSQICSLTNVRSSIDIILLAYSTPTVTLYCSENSPFKKRIIRLLFPTHEY